VVASLFDPRRAEIYRRLGLLTFSSTELGAERVYELLAFPDLEPVMTFGKGEVVLARFELPAHLDGRQARDLTVGGEISVISVSRHGSAFIPLQGSTFQSGDLLYLVVQDSAINRLKAMLGYGEGE
jgi:trk system potassium uptake protein TrkA